jgi:hypothetical protein
MCDYRWDMDWILDLLTTQYAPLGTTSNYSAIAKLHTLQITTALAKFSPACYVFTSHSLATASNSGDSKASRSQVRPCRTIANSLNCQLSTPELD